MNTEKRPKVEVRPSAFDKGLFAAEPIAEGQLIVFVTGKIIDYDTTVALGDMEAYPMQVAINGYICAGDAELWQYANHSCAPNCGVSGQGHDLAIVALRPIEKDEELFYDYSTTMLERSWNLQACGCGQPSCRGVIQDFDQLPAALQAFYLEKGMVVPYILPIVQANEK